MKIVNRIVSLALAAFLVILSSAEAQIQPVNWTHLSSATGDLPVPPASNGQVGLRVVDLDKNGQLDYVITLWNTAETVVWYRQLFETFEKYVIDTEPQRLSHGHKFKDIDGDGDIDLIFGDASLGNKIYWWENPYPDYEPNTHWVRRIVRDTGGNYYHDNIWGDFDGDGSDEFISWNQGGLQLLLFEIPADPKNSGPWPVTQIFSWTGPELKYRGADAIDINLDGKIDFVGGCGWFEHTGETNFTFHQIDESMGYSQIVAGQLISGGRPEIVCVLELEAGPLNMYEWTGSEWQTRTILADVPRSHTLQLGDVNFDGYMDIVTGEIGNWIGGSPPDNPNAKISVLYNDGDGNFTQQVVFPDQGDLEGRLADIDNDGDLDIVAKAFRHNIPRVDIHINNGEADISVSKVVDNDQPFVGDSGIFTVIAINNGPNSATGVQITDQLPFGLMYESNPSQGNYNSSTGVWNVGSLANGLSAVLQITARVDQSGNITNTASRTASIPTDPNESNNSDTADLTGQTDNCPDDPDKIEPGICGCGVADTDTDNDGTPDCNDNCVSDPNKTQPGICGCGVSDVDSDNDGIPDCNDDCDNSIDTDGDGTNDCDDLCPADPNKTESGTCGCGVADTDTDNDGTPDCNDNCPNDPGKIIPGICGCGVPDVDSDNNGIPDCNDDCDNSIDTDGDGTNDCDDLCPADPNKTESGTCGCGIADTDSDSDGIMDCEEQGPTGDDPNYDGNGDGIPDSQQANVVSLQTFNNLFYVTLESPPGTIISNCHASGNPSPADAPSGVEFSYGFFEFTIEGMGVGGDTTVTFHLPAEAAPTTYYKYGRTLNNPTDHWYEFLFDGQTGANINGNIITMHLVDGLKGDDDLSSNGSIVDIGGQATAIAIGGNGGGTSSRGGCFIATAAYGSPTQPYVTILREFRDRFLLKNSIGKDFVNLYYTYSPQVAAFITKHANLLVIVRVSLLPVVGVSWLFLKIGPVSTMALMLFFCFGLMGLMRVRRRLRS